MNWLKSNAVPLAVGAVVGYMVAKRGGIGGVVAQAKSAAK